MNDAVAITISFIHAHAAWVFPIMFAVSFGKSFAFVSLIFPGTTILIAAGALIPDGTLRPLPILAGAILGAILGDAISYEIGKRLGPQINAMWPLSRWPDLFARSNRLFTRFGTASVFIGRFFGPARAMIPLVAGIGRMPTLSFWSANIGSALIWAPALLLPGQIAAIIADNIHIASHWKTIAYVGIALGLMAFIPISGILYRNARNLRE